MRRIALWALSTVASLLLLFGYHTSTQGVLTAAGAGVPAVHAGAVAGSGTATATATVTTGEAVATRYGPVQVEITVDRGAVVGVSVPRYPRGSSRDEQINGYALPILVRDTLAAQSAQVDMVSGATVTSTGYRESLQSALDRAGL